MAGTPTLVLRFFFVLFGALISLDACHYYFQHVNKSWLLLFYLLPIAQNIMPGRLLRQLACGIPIGQ